jgi:dihydroxy-acid dehydratase
MRYILPSREIICASVEIMLEAHRLDGVVVMSSCDKITPAMIMAAARVDIPAVFLPAGVMMAGSYDGRKLTLSSTREYSARCAAGEMTLEEMTRIEEASCPTLGTCSMMGTANTMACLTEALGLALPQSTTTLAVSSAKMRQALETGRLAVRLVNEGLRPSLILTRAALENAARVGLAIGGSTNLVLHLLALSNELDLGLDLVSIDRLSDETPCLVRVSPSGRLPSTILTMLEVCQRS